jgi:hypothetical protein
MPAVELLRALSPQRLGLTDDRVVVFGVLGGQRAGPTLLVHAPTLLDQLRQLPDHVGRVVFAAGSSVDAMTVATINAMLSAMGSEDGLVQFLTAAEAIKLTRGGKVMGKASDPTRVIDRSIDRSTLVSFCPPEVLRVPALVGAVGVQINEKWAADKWAPEAWVNPAGLVVANGGRIETYPRAAVPA